MRRRGPPGSGTVAPRSAQLARPDVRVAALVAGDLPERVGAPLVLLDLREAVVERDRVALQLEVLQALGDVDRGHRRNRSRSGGGTPGPSVPLRTIAAMSLPPLRWFGAADVVAAMPPLEERLRARGADDDRPGAARRERAAAEDRDPSAARRFVRARDAGPSPRRTPAADDLVGMKWVAGYATERRRSAWPRSARSSS